MDEERWMEDELDAALGGIVAPPSLSPAVMRRVNRPRMTRLPEILDSIGGIAVLVAVLLALSPFAPSVDPSAAYAGLAVAFTSLILWHGWRSLRALNG
ncbi:MAG: hypothetical protein JSU00_16490 [Acidobacteria bacterium]|nr:hypothetical protein [Acidobacteriota bacterium]